MTKEVIHGHNSVAPRLHFFFFFFFYVFPSAFRLLGSFFLFPYMAIYRKSHLVQGKLAQASWLLRVEGQARARPSEWLA